MVAWLAPSILLKSGLEVALSGLFANFADKRELMGGLDDGLFTVGDDAEPEFWFDFVSDTGDGFDPTYTIAKLASEPQLAFAGDDITQRGRVLVLGGDQVYPSANWEAYEERFRLPWEKAFPASGEAKATDPQMFAIPGNHDWYDGLTSFMRVFCQSGRVGAWRTRQRRSYFALKLPRNWWLWGIDVQFDSYIDGPQLKYFTDVAKKTGDHDKIILATAKPSWVNVEDPKHPPQSWKSIAYFDEQVLCKNGAQLAVTITGDLHHYARYDQCDPDETVALGAKITAGGGGAYLSPTHWLPERVELPEVTRTKDPMDNAAGEPTRYERRTEFPDAQASRKLVGGIRGHLSPFATPTLGLVLAAAYGLLAIVLAAGVRDQETHFPDGNFFETLADSVTPWWVLAVAGLGFGLFRWAGYGDAPRPLGAVHAAAHLLLIWGATVAMLSLDPFDLGGFFPGYLAALVAALVGVIVGRWILVLYLWIANSMNDRWHANEVFSSQGIADYKNFLRFKIDAQGELTMYAIGVEDVPKWRLGADGTPEIADGELSPHLIEKLTIRAPTR